MNDDEVDGGGCIKRAMPAAVGAKAAAVADDAVVVVLLAMGGAFQVADANLAGCT